MQWGSFFLSLGPGKLYDVNDNKSLDMDGVTSIVISGVSDDMTIQSGGDKTMADLTGQCRTAGTPVHLETGMNGGTLSIQVKYPMGSNSSNTQLAVTIPADYQGNLSLSTVSGSTHCEGMPFTLKQVSLNSVSGDIVFSTASCTSLKAGSISGGITLSGIAGTASVNTVSGGIHLDYAQAAATTVTTVSGDVHRDAAGQRIIQCGFRLGIRRLPFHAPEHERQRLSQLPKHKRGRAPHQGQHNVRGPSHRRQISRLLPR